MTSLLIILVSMLTCCGQLCQKQAVEQWHHCTSNTIREKIHNGWLWAGLLMLGLGMLLWLIVLQTVPLSIAYPMLSFNFVLVTLVAKYWFREPAPWSIWCGVGLIICGIILVEGPWQ